MRDGAALKVRGFLSQQIWGGAFLIAAIAPLAACSAPADPLHSAGATPRSTAVVGAEAATALSAGTSGMSSPNRRPLGAAVDDALPVELLSMAGGAHVLAVAHDERVTWARTIDEHGALGKTRGFEGAHVVTAVAGSDGRTTFVTSDGDRICVTTFAHDAEVAAAHGCKSARPEMVVPIGERIALLSLDITETPTRVSVRAKAAAAGSGVKKGGAVKDAGAAKGGAAKGGAAKGGADGKTAGAAKDAGAAKGGAAKGGAARKPKGVQGGGGKKKPSKKRKSSDSVVVPAAKAKVGVRVAWASREGVFEASGAASGLTFERPLAGMMLVDAVPRGTGADLLFYEAVSKPRVRSKTSLGSARLGVASLGPDGALVAGTRAGLLDGDLEYGFITGQNRPRLAGGTAGTALVSYAGRGGVCQAQRVFPALGTAVLSKAGCAVDPLGWSLGGGGLPDASAAAERLLAADPRRAPGQRRGDGPLVAWAGDRALFGGLAGFGTASRGDGTPTVISPPFAAKRARLAWGAFAPDGEGIAVSGGRVVHVDTAGAVTEAASVEAVDALGTRAAEAVRSSVHGATERRRAARIGDTFWMARGDVVRLFPRPTRLDALAGRAHADSTALVGGRERGLFLEVASGMLRTTFVAKDGALTAGPLAVSPVRPGFDATERGGANVSATGTNATGARANATSASATGANASGAAANASSAGATGANANAAGTNATGAIVAGVSAQDPTRVVAFVIDADGKLGAPGPTSLAVTAGTFAVHITALPGGGALLTDDARRRVVWLDDDATERGSAPWPDGHAAAACLDGRPAPLVVPSPEAGKFVRVSELASPGTCISGDVAWSANGSLRWFGSTVRGIDSTAEVGVLDAVLPTAAPTPAAPAPAPAPSMTAAPLKIPCPADMVSIAGRFCIDRFESTLADAKTWRVLSPDYPPTPNLLEIVLGDWATDRTRWGDAHARAFPLPPVPTWQRGAKTEPVAVARFAARPNGYITGVVAEAACAAAGKRLCLLDEFSVACRGEGDTDFPYGTDYQDGVCNVYREDHPAALLHRNASLGHLDPRLNRVRAKGKPLFETTGARPACRSLWGPDAVYDLVGNLDEWVDEGTGAFAGGFYSRSTRAGCDAVITAHPKLYADYSTGVRCCKDADD